MLTRDAALLFAALLFAALLFAALLFTVKFLLVPHYDAVLQAATSASFPQKAGLLATTQFNFLFP